MKVTKRMIRERRKAKRKRQAMYLSLSEVAKLDFAQVEQRVLADMDEGRMDDPRKQIPKTQWANTYGVDGKVTGRVRRA